MIKKDPVKKISTETESPKASVETEAEGEAEGYHKHEIEGAADTLMRAEEIKAKPKLHGHAMEHMKSKHAAMGKAMAGGKPGSLDELRKIASKKSAE